MANDYRDICVCFLAWNARYIQRQKLWLPLYEAVQTLNFNLKTDKYRQRFIDAYGRNEVDEDILRIVAAVEVFR